MGNELARATATYWDDHERAGRAGHQRGGLPIWGEHRAPTLASAGQRFRREVRQLAHANPILAAEVDEARAVGGECK